jgi:hypothetical protein
MCTDDEQVTEELTESPDIPAHSAGQSLDNFPQPFLDSFHEEDSIYRGLSIREQLRLGKLRRGNKKPPAAILQRLKKATDVDYGRILAHCTKAILMAFERSDVYRIDRINIYIRVYFKYRLLFNKGWPKGRVVSADDWSVTIQYKADGIVDYLHSIGKSYYDSKSLRKAVHAIRRESDHLDWLEDFSIDLCYTEGVNDVVARWKREDGRKGNAKNFTKNVDKIVKKEDNAVLEI